MIREGVKSGTILRSNRRENKIDLQMSRGSTILKGGEKLAYMTEIANVVKARAEPPIMHFLKDME